MRNLLIGLLGAAVLGTGGYAAASELDHPEPARTVSLPAATSDTGAAQPAATTFASTTEDDSGDVSGPCDEAEHAGDPRCAGGLAPPEDDDADDDRDDHDDHDDRSGSNSGRG